MGRKKNNKAGSDKKKASERLKLRRDVLYTLADDSLQQVGGALGTVGDDGGGSKSNGSACRPTYSRGL